MNLFVVWLHVQPENGPSRVHAFHVESQKLRRAAFFHPPPHQFRDPFLLLRHFLGHRVSPLFTESPQAFLSILAQALLCSTPFLSFPLTSFHFFFLLLFSLLTENLILKTQNSVRGKPSIQWNRRPCEPRRFLRSQEYRHLRHIRGLPEAPQGDQGDPPRPQRVPLSAGGEESLPHFRFHDRRADAIYAYVLMPVVDGHGLRQHRHSALRRAVRRAILHRHESKHRPDIHDGSPAAFSKLRQHCPRHQKRPLYIDRHHPVPLFFVDPLHRRDMQRPRIVHQHIQPPESLHGSLHRAFDVPGAGHIALQRQSGAALLLDFADHFSKLFQPSSRHGHARAFPRKRQRDRSTAR